MGSVCITSRITRESTRLSFGVLHLGDHNLSGGARPFQDEAAYQAMAQGLIDPFEEGDIPGVLHTLDRQFPELTYSIKSLFKDEQRQVMQAVLASTLEDAENLYHDLYERYTPLMLFLSELRMPEPGVLQAAAEFALNGAIRRNLEPHAFDHGLVMRYVDQARRVGVGEPVAAPGVDTSLFTNVRYSSHFSCVTQVMKTRHEISLNAAMPQRTIH